jgi:uncharacterized cupin superfamily protein
MAVRATRIAKEPDMTTKPTAAAISAAQVPAATGSSYPEPYRSRVATRRKQRLGDAFGLTHFGVNLTTIPPGSASALRHWHSHEDEFVYVLSGELVLVTNGGEQRLGPGMCAGFPAGNADGHCLVNRTDREAVYLEIGDRRPDDGVTYPDEDLACRTTPQGRKFFRKDGTSY